MTGHTWHHIALALHTKSGLDNEVWFYHLLGMFEEADVRKGPLLRRSITARTPATIRELDTLFHRYLLVVKNERPDLIVSEVDVGQDYSVCWSL